MTGSSTRRFLLGAALAAPALRAARAEAPRLRIARQYGLAYAQLVLMEDQRLIEQHAERAGLGAIDVGWSTFRASDVMNDALMSGGLDVASLGVPGLGVIWGRTAGQRYEVKGLVGFNAAPQVLVTREASVTSIADFRPGLKIALPAVRVSNQAIFLQMAAARQWGPAEYARLDPLTVSMAHPDAAAMLISGGSEITSYFGAPPFTQRAMRVPGVHEVTNSYAILGGPVTFNVLTCSTAFYRDNPRLAGAVVSALAEATAQIVADPRRAAEAYIRLTADKTPADEMAEMMTNVVSYTLDLQGTLPVLQFMAQTGVMKTRPAAWSDYMHPSAAAFRGG